MSTSLSFEPTASPAQATTPAPEVLVRIDDKLSIERIVGALTTVMVCKRESGTRLLYDGRVLRDITFTGLENVKTIEIQSNGYPIWCSGDLSSASADEVVTTVWRGWNVLLSPLAGFCSLHVVAKPVDLTKPCKYLVEYTPVIIDHNDFQYICKLANPCQPTSYPNEELFYDGGAIVRAPINGHQFKSTIITSNIEYSRRALSERPTTQRMFCIRGLHGDNGQCLIKLQNDPDMIALAKYERGMLIDTDPQCFDCWVDGENVERFQQVLRKHGFPVREGRVVMEQFFDPTYADYRTIQTREVESKMVTWFKGFIERIKTGATPIEVDLSDLTYKEAKQAEFTINALLLNPAMAPAFVPTVLPGRDVVASPLTLEEARVVAIRYCKGRDCTPPPMTQEQAAFVNRVINSRTVPEGFQLPVGHVSEAVDPTAQGC